MLVAVVRDDRKRMKFDPLFEKASGLAAFACP
jgi:hypothetical protein